MTTLEELSDEDTPAGIRIRLRAIEARQRRIEAKLDRLLGAVVIAAIGYVLSIYFGGGGPS